MITTSTHRIPFGTTDAFTVDLIRNPENGDVSLVVDHVEIALLHRRWDETDDAWVNRCTTTRDAVVATCERIVKELPRLAGLPPLDPSHPTVSMDVSLDAVDRFAIFEAQRLGD